MAVGKGIRSTRILRLLLPYYVPQITFEIPFKGYFEAVPRTPISSGFSPLVSLHSTLDHILVEGSVGLTLYAFLLGDSLKSFYSRVFQEEEPRQGDPQVFLHMTHDHLLVDGQVFTVMLEGLNIRIYWQH